MDPHAEPNPNHSTGVPRIGVLTGYWSTNIGNAFFQLGAQYALNRAYPDAHVFLIGDQPGYWNTRKGNPANALDYVKHLELDAVVVLGPYVRPEMEGITAEMLRAQHRKGAKIIVLAAGMMQYDKDTIALSRRLMSECPPYMFTTRDTETYEALGDLAAHAYDGVDVATFVPEVFPKVATDLGPYIVLNFDQIPEPEIGPREGFRGRVDAVIAFEGREWCVRHRRHAYRMSHRRREYPFLDALLFRNDAPERIDGRLVLRTDHRYNPFLMAKTYRHANSYAGDVPFTYLNIYANSMLTISNRVHACVATVSYGNPAMLFSRSPRAFLLKRLGLDAIKDRPQRVDMGFLAREKSALLGWMGARLRECFGPAPQDEKRRQGHLMSNPA